jgi:oxaloacetate decarboxylase gamma subunit
MDMLGQSGVLTLLGIGVVFGFLVIMIISITLAGKIIHALGWDKDVQTAAGSTVHKTGNNSEITAAIGAAVNQYKKNN